MTFAAPSEPGPKRSRHARRPQCVLALTACMASILTGVVSAQVPTFAGNAQHTSNYAAPAQTMNAIRWSVSIDENATGAFVHYGSPLITAAGTVITGIKIAGDAFKVSAFSAATGTLKYSLTTDYILPTHNWIPVYNPAIVTGPWGTRLYYAGAGGTVYHVDNIDSNTPGSPVREVFYTSLANYVANAGAYNSTIFINTPITSDQNGNIFFGFRVQNTAPAPLSTTQSGFARIDATGTGTYVLAGTAAGDANIARDSHNSAPALGNDGSTLYVVVKSPTTSNYGYLVALNSTTLATRSAVFLRDPRNSNGAGILDDGTASPMVGPDGDVFLGVMANPSNGSRGWLLHFSGDLATSKVPGAFGWDYTPGVVPASMVAGYSGASTYLLAAKYNNYPFVDGDGVNKIAILDPNAVQTDFHSTASGLGEMREVMTVIGFTPDTDNPTVPNAVREWCVNALAVNPSTNSVFMPAEDGRIYRWNLAENSVTQSVALSAGIGEPYVPTVIGPDGTIYTLNGGYLFAIGGSGGANLTLDSSAPSIRTSVAGDSVTFTAHVTSGGAAPTGTVTFSDVTFSGFTPVTTTLASNVPLDATGQASVTTNALQAGGTFLGNHWITAAYSGDVNFQPANVTRVQKIHAYATTTTGASSPSPSPSGSSVTLTATVTSTGGTPSGYVTFMDGTSVIGQTPLNASGVATFTTNALATGAHTITTTYYSDTHFAASLSSFSHAVGKATTTTASGSPNPSAVGQSVTFTATVVASGGAAGTPTGTVTFKDGTTTIGSSPVDGTGHAATSTSSLAAGSHTISANFAGSGGWLDSSGSTTQSVGDNTPPLQVTGVTATPGPPKRQITVKWKATTDPGGTVAAYLVYSSASQSGPFTLLTTVTTLSYGDALTGSGITRWYYVVARDAAGNPSTPSSTVSAKSK